ncbi:MAG: sensor histidine kinase [Anaerolineae bacterium]|nr:sensor histidine kinase [Anaerolineae bacterium]
MRSLWLKLMGAFALVILVGTGVIVFLTGRATTGQFELYVTQTGQQWAVRLAPLLADYYARTGSWDGVGTVLGNPWMAGAAAPGMKQGWMGGEGMMGGMEEGMMGHMGEGADHSQRAASGMMMGDSMWATFGNRLILANAEGTVVADTAEALLGTQLPADDVGRGMPIMLNEQQVGTLIVTPFAAPATPASDFLSAVNRSVLWAGLIAGVVALVLGSVLFFQVVRPLRSLSTAAQGIAQGDLSQRAHVGARDEVGQVAETFNQMAESLQRYAAERQNMIADVAHELRTPLSVIQSNLEAMLDGVLPASPEELTSLHQETLLLNRLITDLRTLSLAEAGQLRLEKQPVDLGALVQQVGERLRLRAEEKNIVLETEVAHDLPVIQADPERLTQVITNLVDNALRYTPPGTRVSVTAQAAPGGIELLVHDTGPGIPPEDLPHIFDRFWRAEKSRNRATGGSGLGLAIIKQLVEAHGGQAHVESQVGIGTRFRIYLPST